MKSPARTLQGHCHCQTVQFEFDLDIDDSDHDLRRCNCSLCRRKGAIMLGIPVGRFRILRGADNLSLYQWNHHIARHYFCKTCGIYTHHQRRSNPLEIGINTGCIEGTIAAEFETDIIGNGKSLSLANN